MCMVGTCVGVCIDDTGVGAWLMHLLWYMVDGTC
jgi:hypothetical protein